MGHAYARLVERLERMNALRDAAEMLAWDQQTMMPPGGTPARAAQMAALGATIHDLLASPETGRLLQEAEREETDPDRVAVLRETRFAYDRATLVPGDLVQATAAAQAKGFEAWADARRRSDYKAFQPHLARLLDLRRQYAQHVAPDAPPYEALFQDYEPWVPLAEARGNLARLREGLRPLIAKARARDAKAPTTFDGDWPVEKQAELCRRAVAMLGYDFQRGRLDVSPHPFSAGGAHDARITTRYDPSNPLSALLGAIHEAGHAMYMQGLPTEHAGTPLGEARDLVVHESQSRLWENNVGRSLPFWRKTLPLVREVFPGTLAHATPEDAWRAASHVEPS
ncbi:MAG TPA: carboxypeptidase M32, partial [Candidatus Thermoplasmatota archaeon]|nr:carboxypeptidase M32 [Candidatus Thermoplasmatota archaeon]